MTVATPIGFVIPSGDAYVGRLKDAEKTMAIATIIVNYNTADMVLRHLPAIREESATVPGSKIFIVDNASPGGDAAPLLEATRDMDDVIVVAAPENGGFSYGNNRGFEAARADGAFDYFFMLNPDAYPRPGCLRTLVQFMDAHPTAGIVAPRLEGEDGIGQRSAFREITVPGELISKIPLGPLQFIGDKFSTAMPLSAEVHECRWVAGAAALLRATALEDTGDMDEDYFLYFEEVDHHRRFRERGHQVWYQPAAVAVHLVGQATGIVDGKQENAAPPDYWYDSRHLYFRKNFGTEGARWADRARGAAFRILDLRKKLTGKGAHGAEIDVEKMKLARARAEQR